MEPQSLPPPPQPQQQPPHGSTVSPGDSLSQFAAVPSSPSAPTTLSSTSTTASSSNSNYVATAPRITAPHAASLVTSQPTFNTLYQQQLQPRPTPPPAQQQQQQQQHAALTPLASLSPLLNAALLVARPHAQQQQPQPPQQQQQQLVDLSFTSTTSTPPRPSHPYTYASSSPSPSSPSRHHAAVVAGSAALEFEPDWPDTSSDSSTSSNLTASSTATSNSAPSTPTRHHRTSSAPFDTDAAAPASSDAAATRAGAANASGFIVSTHYTSASVEVSRLQQQQQQQQPPGASKRSSIHARTRSVDVPSSAVGVAGSLSHSVSPASTSSPLTQRSVAGVAPSPPPSELTTPAPSEHHVGTSAQWLLWRPSRSAAAAPSSASSSSSSSSSTTSSLLSSAPVSRSMQTLYTTASKPVEKPSLSTSSIPSSGGSASGSSSGTIRASSVDGVTGSLVDWVASTSTQLCVDSAVAECRLESYRGSGSCVILIRSFVRACWRAG